MQAAAEGVGMYFAAGDASGVSAPASDPYAIAVGGTTLGIGKSMNRLFETGWSTGGLLLQKGTWVSQGEEGASGGGPSVLWKQQAYQRGIVPVTLAQSPGHSGLFRSVPDISADADPDTPMAVGLLSVTPGQQPVFSLTPGSGTSALRDVLPLTAASPSLYREELCQISVCGEQALSVFDVQGTGKSGHDTGQVTLLRLMDGRGHSAGDLATTAGVSASGASAHLRHLIDADLVTVAVVGRTREHTIASAEVAAAIEALAAISPMLPVESLRQARSGSQLRTARACYSHLGGELAVAVADHLAAAGAIDPLLAASPGTLHHLHAPLLAALHITELKPGSGPGVRGCLDWTERRPHLAGRLGTTIMRAMLERSWLTRRPSGRALTITSLGTRQLTQLGIDPGRRPASPRRPRSFRTKAPVCP